MAIKVKYNSGFVILFAVLVSTIILIVSAGIFNFAFKSSLLSSYSGESQLAFYAADTGLECALYWDISPEIEETAFDENSSTRATATCAEKTLDIQDDDVDRFWFWLDLDGLSDTTEHGCAFVLVDKDAFHTIIESEEVAWTEITVAGYNSCETIGGVTSTNKGDINLVERRMNSQYPWRVVE